MFVVYEPGFLTDTYHVLAQGVFLSLSSVESLDTLGCKAVFDKSIEPVCFFWLVFVLVHHPLLVV